MTIDHVGPERLAAFLDHQLVPSAREEVVTHFAECAACRREMTAMRQLLADRRKGKRWGIVTPLLLAAAAVFVFAVALPVRRGDRMVETSVRSGVERMPADGPRTITMIRPVEDAPLEARRTEFLWRSTGPGATYRLTLQDSTGAAVWVTTVEDTVAVLPDSIRLAPGQYFWSVAARLPNARSAITGVRRFLAR